MRSAVAIKLSVAAAVAMSFCFASETAGSVVPVATSASVGAPSRVPYGWVDFCGRHPEECDLGPLAPRDIALSSATWRLLDRVNRETNHAIEPISNLDHWGTVLDHWDYPVDGMGDCKIYALEKRRILIEAGLPRQALLMTIVLDLDGQGHAILTVKTDHGDFVLDNLSNEVRPWNATGYTFLKRQAQDDPNTWLDLGRARGLTSETASLKADRPGVGAP